MRQYYHKCGSEASFPQYRGKSKFTFFVIQCTSSILGTNDIALDTKKDGTLVLFGTFPTSIGFEVATFIQFAILRCLVKIEFSKVRLVSRDYKQQLLDISIFSQFSLSFTRRPTLFPGYRG